MFFVLGLGVFAETGVAPKERATEASREDDGGREGRASGDAAAYGTCAGVGARETGVSVDDESLWAEMAFTFSCGDTAVSLVLLIERRTPDLTDVLFNDL